MTIIKLELQRRKTPEGSTVCVTVNNWSSKCLSSGELSGLSAFTNDTKIQFAPYTHAESWLLTRLQVYVSSFFLKYLRTFQFHQTSAKWQVSQPNLINTSTSYNHAASRWQTFKELMFLYAYSAGDFNDKSWKDCLLVPVYFTSTK